MEILGIIAVSGIIFIAITGLMSESAELEKDAQEKQNNLKASY